VDAELGAAPGPDAAAGDGLVMTPGRPGRPQAAKLGLKPGQRVRLHNPPDGWALSDPPAGLADPGPDGPADVIVAFFTRAGEIGEQIGELARRIYPAGALWVAWPRRAAGHRSDITDTVIREYALPIGLVDVKVAAIDDDWSGLRVVWRTEHRRLFPALGGGAGARAGSVRDKGLDEVRPEGIVRPGPRWSPMGGFCSRLELSLDPAAH
jgi:hypothetical protein